MSTHARAHNSRPHRGRTSSIATDTVRPPSEVRQGCSLVSVPPAGQAASKVVRRALSSAARSWAIRVFTGWRLGPCRDVHRAPRRRLPGVPPSPRRRRADVRPSQEEGAHCHPEEPGNRVETQVDVVGDLVVGGRGPPAALEGPASGQAPRADEGGLDAWCFTWRQPGCGRSTRDGWVEFNRIKHRPAAAR